MSQIQKEDIVLKDKERELVQQAKDKGINLEHLESEKKKQQDEKLEKEKDKKLKKEAKNIDIQKKAVDSIKKKGDIQEK